MGERYDRLGLFISADPNDFVTQFMGNVRESGTHNGLHRFPLTDAIAGFITEIRERYLGRYGMLEGAGSLNRLKAIVFVISLLRRPRLRPTALQHPCDSSC
jgi:hypothetical protein